MEHLQTTASVIFEIKTKTTWPSLTRKKELSNDLDDLGNSRITEFPKRTERIAELNAGSGGGSLS